MEKAYLVYRRSWTGRVSPAIVFGEKRASLEQVDPEIGRYELKGPALDLATGQSQDKFARLCAQHPLGS